MSDTDLLFTSDQDGKELSVGDIKVPPQTIHTVTMHSVTDRAPEKGSEWIIEGAYSFLERLEAEAEQAK